jgi:hypothetical protein
MPCNTVFRHAYSALRPKADDAPAPPLSPQALVLLRVLPDEREKPAGVLALAQKLSFSDADIALVDMIEHELGGLMSRGLAQRVGLGWTRWWSRS